MHDSVAVKHSPPAVERFRVLVIGDEATGKTSLARLAQGQTAPRSYSMTTTPIVSLARRVALPDGRVADLVLVDMPGATTCHQRDDWAATWAGADGFVVVTRGDDAAAIAGAQRWLQRAATASTASGAPAAVLVVSRRAAAAPTASPAAPAVKGVAAPTASGFLGTFDVVYNQSTSADGASTARGDAAAAGAGTGAAPQGVAAALGALAQAIAARRGGSAGAAGAVAADGASASGRTSRRQL